ncbi:MAG: hypothetical protein ACFFCW_00910 [Candidatus Hodarchaeota archaeon]
MMEVNNENDISVRSMSARGSLGRLSAATGKAVKILDAFGKDFTLIERAGAGQAEVDVVRELETTVVVCVPGLGDEIQIMKARVIEMGDIWEINKADKNEANCLVEEMKAILQLGHA